MEDNETKKSEVDGLGLIDVASEDDSLLFSSFPDPTSYEFSENDKDENGLKDDKELSFLSDTHYCDEEILVSSIEEKEEVLQPHQSPEPQKVMNKGKYNLRKSLAWDNAFFTSAGVLEPEELSSMMESNHKNERKGLPTIQEDINRSTESISTFQSDCTVENSQEFVLFEDVRASIQRSATPGKYNELGATQVATSPTSSTVDVLTSQKKMRPKASPKKPSIRAQGLGKATKQPVATRGLSTSISKPPNGLSKVRPFSTTSTNKASLDTSKTKQEKNSKLPTGKEPLAPRISIFSRNARPTLPKPSVPKSTLRSSAASKNELTSSCSSLESCASASSSASRKSSLDSIKKNDSSSRLASQSLANRSTSRGIMGQPRIPTNPTNRTSKSKLSSGVPTTGSISDGSSESSRASATSKTAKDNQKTVSVEKAPANDDTVTQTMKPLKNSKDASAVQADAKEGMKRVSGINGGLVPPTSGKPSGLRVPTPKIGFFDGGRHGSSSSASKKSVKSQLGRSPNQDSKTKAGSKVQNKLYSKINAEDQLEG